MSSKWDQGPDPSRKRPSSEFSRPPSPPRKRVIPENASALAGMTKSELQAALLLPDQSFKELRDIAKKLEQYSAVNREGQIDPYITAAEIVLKKYPQPQVFSCFRCDHTKISNMKAKWRKDKLICHSCHDHLTRCIVPYKDLPDHQKPKKCIHQVPKSYQKEFR
jgi:hypothetical protein